MRAELQARRKQRRKMNLRRRQERSPWGDDRETRVLLHPPRGNGLEEEVVDSQKVSKCQVHSSAVPLRGWRFWAREGVEDTFAQVLPGKGGREMALALEDYGGKRGPASCLPFSPPHKWERLESFYIRV